jgi:exodeoxyribonuclease VII large subunit
MVACGRKDLHASMARLLRAHPQRRVADQRLLLGGLERRLAQAGNRLLTTRRHSLEGLTSKLDALSPLKVLDRGYSLTRDAHGKLVRSCEVLEAGQPLTVTLQDGDLHTRIEEIVIKSPSKTPESPGQD